MLHSVVGRVARRIHVIRHKASMSATARAIVNDRLTYLSPTKLNRLEGALREVLRNDVRGDFVEFGIALGGSTLIRSEEHTSELQSLMRISYAVFCLNKPIS